MIVTSLDSAERKSIESLNVPCEEMIFLSICRGKVHETSLLEVFSALNQMFTEPPAVAGSDATVKVNVPSCPRANAARPGKKPPASTDEIFDGVGYS